MSNVRGRLVLVLLLACAVVFGAASAAGTATPLPGFRSPSGNIRCLAVPGPPATLLCSIGKASYAARLQTRCMRPDGAGVDWHGFALGATGEGRISCSGGILYDPRRQPSYVTLPYGKRWRQATFTCWSRRTGVACTNGPRHGLIVSRREWRVW